MVDQSVKSNAFTEEGRLLQAEYAIKNVSKAGTIAGLVCEDGVILVGINPIKSSTIEKIYNLDNSTYCAVSGVFSDALRLIKFARLESANITEDILQTPKTSVLCNYISKEKQKYTHYGGSRPFGVSFLYSGYENGEYVLYSTDPSGTINRWRAWSFGTDEDSINSKFRNDLEPGLYNMESGILQLFKIIGKAREWTPDIADKMEVLFYKKSGSRMLNVDEIRNIIQEIESEKLNSSV